MEEQLDDIADDRIAKSLNLLAGDREYQNLYSQLSKLRNKLTSCPEHWSSSCNRRLKEVNSVLDEWKYEYLEMRSKEFCKEFLSSKSMSMYNSCIAAHKRRGMMTIHEQISRQKNFLNNI